MGGDGESEDRLRARRKMGVLRTSRLTRGRVEARARWRLVLACSNGKLLEVGEPLGLGSSSGSTCSVPTRREPGDERRNDSRFVLSDGISGAGVFQACLPARFGSSKMIKCPPQQPGDGGGGVGVKDQSSVLSPQGSVVDGRE